MGRPAKHSEARILDAAATIVSKSGPNAATMTSIGEAIGAPSGSLYHRFRTRDELMGRLWLSKAQHFQDSAMQALKNNAGVEGALAAALSIARVSREDFPGARIMLLYRREDFLSAGWPTEMKRDATKLGAQVQDMIAEATKRISGRNTALLRRTATFAVFDLPMAAVRRYVAAGEPPPASVDGLISRAFYAVIEPS